MVSLHHPASHESSNILSEIQAKALSLKVEVFYSSGKNIEHTGGAGELVCMRPPLSHSISGMILPAKNSVKPTLTLSRVFGGKAASQLSTSPPMASLGRSDGVFDPSGVRFNLVPARRMPSWNSSSGKSMTICAWDTRRQRDKDETVLLFLKMRPGHLLTPDLEKRIRGAIRTALSARHVPKYIFETEDIPVSGVVLL